MKHENGFTLIEVLVSFVILSGAIILSFESYASGLRGLHQAQDVIEAQDLSQAVLARVLGDDAEVTDGEKGREGMFEWQVFLKPVGLEKSVIWQPLAVTVRVSDSQGRDIPSASLSTIKLQVNPTP
jgi:prepilin-type N-terminal cleavage/methylation domain-containing protein